MKKLMCALCILVLAVAGCPDDPAPQTDADADVTASDAATDTAADTPVEETAVDTGPAVVSVRCHLQLYTDECVTCGASSCSAENIAAFGIAGVPEVAGGSCSEFLVCLTGCTCKDDACKVGCALTALNAGCQSDLAALKQCMESSCAGACGECGNKRLDIGEECDGAATTASCTDFEFADSGGAPACTEKCFWGGGTCVTDKVPLSDCVDAETVPMGKPVELVPDFTNWAQPHYRVASRAGYHIRGKVMWPVGSAADPKISVFNYQCGTDSFPEDWLEKSAWWAPDDVVDGTDYVFEFTFPDYTASPRSYAKDVYFSIRDQGAGANGDVRVLLQLEKTVPVP